MCIFTLRNLIFCMLQKPLSVAGSNDKTVWLNSFSVGCSAERKCARTGQSSRVSRFGHGPVSHSRYNRGPWFGLAVRH